MDENNMKGFGQSDPCSLNIWWGIQWIFFYTLLKVCRPSQGLDWKDWWLTLSSLHWELHILHHKSTENKPHRTNPNTPNIQHKVHNDSRKGLYVIIHHKWSYVCDANLQVIFRYAYVCMHRRTSSLVHALLTVCTADKLAWKQTVVSLWHEPTVCADAERNSRRGASRTTPHIKHLKGHHSQAGIPHVPQSEINTAKDVCAYWSVNVGHCIRIAAYFRVGVIMSV